MTDYELLKKFIAEHPQEVLWHEIDDSGREVHFTVVLTTPALQEARRKFGSKVIGLDSVWKWTKLHIPIWLLVVDTGTNGGLVVAVVISTSGTADCLARALKQIFSDDGDEIKPKVMIDHDQAERGAVLQLGVCECLFRSNFTVRPHPLQVPLLCHSD